MKKAKLKPWAVIDPHGTSGAEEAVELIRDIAPEFRKEKYKKNWKYTRNLLLTLGAGVLILIGVIAIS